MCVFMSLNWEADVDGGAGERGRAGGEHHEPRRIGAKCRYCRDEQDLMQQLPGSWGKAGYLLRYRYPVSRRAWTLRKAFCCYWGIVYWADTVLYKTRRQLKGKIG